MMQQPELYTCLDGSKTLFVAELNETYHSRNGAIQESLHVFIQQGLQYCLNQQLHEVTIFEMGFGTGLNAWLTAMHVQDLPFTINYLAVETVVLPLQVIKTLDYVLPDDKGYDTFVKLHEAAWNKSVKVGSNYNITKINASMLAVEWQKFKPINLVYFDAFAPDKQPELWTLPVFEMLFNAMQTNGVLVTYSSKGEVKRNLRAAGFKVERLPGPPYKRHMLRAVKP